jgi:hypothetical protein
VYVQWSVTNSINDFTLSESENWSHQSDPNANFVCAICNARLSDSDKLRYHYEKLHLLHPDVEKHVANSFPKAATNAAQGSSDKAKKARLEKIAAMKAKLP